ncbi:MAG: HDOD domain-containing protein [Opitutae bacterium]
MACILLVDPSEVAKRAMSGILARGGHRLAVVSTAQEAWLFLNEHVRVDLVITELELSGGSGIALIQQLKNDAFFKLLPIVLYTEFSDRRDAIKQALALRVQNILVKPYHDDDIYAEIAKTATNPWRNRHFEEEKSFCQQMGFKAEALHRMLEDLRVKLEADRTFLIKAAQAHAFGPVKDRLDALSAQAETAGAWGVVDFLADLSRLTEKGNWASLQGKLATSGVACAIITQHLNPSLLPEPFQTREEHSTAEEDQARAFWFKAPLEGRCPVTSFAQLQVELDNLSGCPVIDSAAAAFEMAANGHPSSMNPLMDVVARDPGLTAQMLISASILRRKNAFDQTPLEDPRLAVGRIGELGMATLARSLVIVEERHMHLPPHFSWPQYWVFQMGVARVARFTCNYLELHSLELQARMAGLLHDIGKLLLGKLHPFAFQSVLAYAREHNVSLAQAEQLFLGCTTHDMAAYFGEKHMLPAPYVSVMRWVHCAEDATCDRPLVATIALARNLCRQNHVGFSGDAPLVDAPRLEETSAWRVLQESVFPSFDLRKFELQVHALCQEIRLEMQGHLQNHRSHEARAAPSKACMQNGGTG